MAHETQPEISTPPPGGDASQPGWATASSPLFGRGAPKPEGVSWMPWAIAAMVVLAVAGGLFAGHRRNAAPANRVLAPDAYASSLAISGIEMSESTSLSGGKSTFVDGRLANRGNRTLDAATVQVIFANDEALPPQIETLPLTLIRTHEPYVDTEPLSAAPIAPGQEREFRLIFESIGSNWNGQVPEIRVIGVGLR